jgi:hypothetical protein
VTAANVSHLPEPRKPRKKASPAAVARQAEAGEGFVTVEHCGVELRIPVGDKVPFSATLRFMGLNDDLTPLGDNENGNLLGTRLLLGEEQWKAFLAKTPSMGDFNAIGDKLQELSGN